MHVQVRHGEINLVGAIHSNTKVKRSNSAFTTVKRSKSEIRHTWYKTTTYGNFQIKIVEPTIMIETHKYHQKMCFESEH